MGRGYGGNVNWTDALILAPIAAFSVAILARGAFRFFRSTRSAEAPACNHCPARQHEVQP